MGERNEFLKELKALMEKHQVNIYGNEDYSGTSYDFVGLGADGKSWTIEINEK